MLHIALLYTVVTELLEVIKNINKVVDNNFFAFIIDENHVIFKQIYNWMLSVTSKYTIFNKQIIKNQNTNIVITNILGQTWIYEYSCCQY